MHTSSHRRLLLIAIALATTLAVCSKMPEASTMRDRFDGVVASTDRAATNAKADIKAAASDVAAATKDACAAVASTARDINITAKGNAELAKDSSLSAVRINGDTKDGRVALNGTAPSTQARERATTLASGFEGVITVDYNLQIDAKRS